MSSCRTSRPRTPGTRVSGGRDIVTALLRPRDPKVREALEQNRTHLQQKDVER